MIQCDREIHAKDLLKTTVLLSVSIRIFPHKTELFKDVIYSTGQIMSEEDLMLEFENQSAIHCNESGQSERVI